MEGGNVSSNETENEDLNGTDYVKIRLGVLSNLAIPETYFFFLVGVYCFVILFSALGSILVILSVTQNRTLRTPSNWFLVNLATSDLLLVSLACPATLAQLSSSSWPLSPVPALCSICLIALDRHHIIVNATRTGHSMAITVGYILTVWICAGLCALPIIPNTKMDVIQLSPEFTEILGITERSYCMEKWDYSHGRLYYSITVLCVQFLMPSTILLLAHIRIYRKLSSLPFWGQLRHSMPSEEIELAAAAQSGVHLTSRVRRMESRVNGKPHRGQKTTNLLVSVVVVFMCAWFPLNFLNVLLDLGWYDIFSTSPDGEENDSLFRILFSVCHLVGMSSALLNPIIYGFFNQGFRGAFYKTLYCCVRRHRPIELESTANITTKF